jgi:hypothetical protein
MHATVLILAAGMGSRYGGLKQVDPVGPDGETLMDYAVFDALRAGFDRIVFVIRHDFAEAFKRQVAARYAGRIAVDYAYQDVNDLPPGFSLPPGREKPWGTAHAVRAARGVVRGGTAGPCLSSPTSPSQLSWDIMFSASLRLRSLLISLSLSFFFAFFLAAADDPLATGDPTESTSSPSFS